MTNPYQQQGLPDPFSDPEKRQIAGRPTLRNLGLGRLIVIIPLAKYRDQPNPFFDSSEPEGKRNSRLRTYIEADVLVCDGAPFMYGGNSRDVADFLGPFPVPGVIRGMEIDKKSILDDIPETQIGGGVIVARLAKQPPKSGSGQPYWVIQKVEPGDPARSVTALQVFNAYKAGQLPTHVPPPVEQQAAQVVPQYNIPPVATQPAQAMQATYNPYASVQQPVSASVPMGGQMVFNAPTGQPNPYAQQSAPPQMQPAPAANPYAQPDPWADMPPNAPDDVRRAWGSLSPQQKDMVRQQLSGAAPTYP